MHISWLLKFQIIGISVYIGADNNIKLIDIWKTGVDEKYFSFISHYTYLLTYQPANSSTITAKAAITINESSSK